MPRQHFPEPEWFDENMVEYAWSIAGLGIAVLTFGLLVACCLTYCVCCRTPGFQFGKGMTVMPEDGYSTDEEDSETMPMTQPATTLTQAKMKRIKKPSYTCLALLAVLILVATVVGTVRKTIIDQEITNNFEYLLRHILADSDVVSEQAVQVNATVGSFLGDVSHLVDSCGENIAPSLLQGITDTVSDNLENIQAMVYNYSAQAVEIPPKIKKVHAFIEENDMALVWLPNIPLITLALVCLGILLEAVVTVCCNTSSCARCADASLKGATVCFVLIVLLVTIVVAVLSTAGVGISQFCQDPDYNTRAYAAYYANSSEIAETVQHYVEGQVTSPVKAIISISRKYIQNLEQIFEALQGVVNTFEKLCAAAKSVNVTTLAVTAIEILNNAEMLLDEHNIWPYYEGIVRKGICYDLVNTLGLMCCFQSVIGLILFPICAIMTHRFLVKWAHYEDGLSAGYSQMVKQ